MDPFAEAEAEVEYIYYIKSILIFSMVYVLYKKFDKSYILLGLLATVPLFLIYELSDLQGQGQTHCVTLNEY